MSSIHIDTDWLLHPTQRPQPNQRVYISPDSGCISQVLALTEPTAEQSGSWLLTPGLINAHCHTELFADEPIPVPSGGGMADWLFSVLAYRGQPESEAELNALLQEASQNSIEAMVSTGTTCLNDISTQGLSAPVIDRLGLRGVVNVEYFHPQPWKAHQPQVIPPNFIQTYKETVARWRGHSRLSIGISPHAPYNVTPSSWQALLNGIADAPPWLVHSHLAETRDEVAWAQRQESSLLTIHRKLLGQPWWPETDFTGTPTQYMAPVLDHQTVLAHAVHLSKLDRRLLKNTQAKLVHCLRSNLWLNGHLPGPHTMDLKAMQREEITVALGTDSLFSCPSLDLRDEARAVQAYHGLSSQALLAMLTAVGADVMGFGDSLGDITLGMWADMVLWWTPQLALTPETVYDAWLSDTTQVVHVWVQGQLCYTNPAFSQAGVINQPVVLP